MKTPTITLCMLLMVLACSPAPKRIALKGLGAEQTPGQGDPSTPSTTVPGESFTYTTAFPRLSHLQWDNSVRDLLLMDASPDLSKNFQADPSGSVFNNNSALLKVSANLWFDYRNAAETMALRVSTTPALLLKLVPASTPTDPTLRGKAIVTPLVRRAFRRTPTATEIEKLVELYKNGLKLSDNKDATAAGVEAVVTAVLQAPQFLYRTELGDGSADVEVKLNAFELASRLSYAVWNSIPDGALLKAAETGDLLKEEGLKKQIQRLVADKKGEDTLALFHNKAFNVDKFVAGDKDKKLFPKWPADLGDAFKKEAELFFREAVITNNGGLKEILTAPYTFVNDKTAPLYGVTAPNGTNFGKVDLDPKQRSGLLTQIGFLASKAHADEPDPIHRGTFMVGEMFCTQLAAPPVTGEVPPPSATLKTLRERVVSLTSAPSCAVCHATMINPAGFAFEHFDATGAWRDTENGQPINAAAEYTFFGADGKIMFDGAADFVSKIVTKKAPHLCYVTKAVEMLYGRRPNAADKKMLDILATKSLKGASAKELFTEILLDASILVRGNQETAK